MGGCLMGLPQTAQPFHGRDETSLGLGLVSVPIVHADVYALG